MIAEIGGKKVVIELPSDVEQAGFNVVTRSLFATDKLQALGWGVSGSMKTKIESTINKAKDI